MKILTKDFWVFDNRQQKKETASTACVPCTTGRGGQKWAFFFEELLSIELPYNAFLHVECSTTSSKNSYNLNVLLNFMEKIYFVSEEKMVIIVIHDWRKIYLNHNLLKNSQEFTVYTTKVIKATAVTGGFNNNPMKKEREGK